MKTTYQAVVKWFQKNLTWVKLFFIGFILLFVFS